MSDFPVLIPISESSAATNSGDLQCSGMDGAGVTLAYQQLAITLLRHRGALPLTSGCFSIRVHGGVRGPYPAVAYCGRP